MTSLSLFKIANSAQSRKRIRREVDVIRDNFNWAMAS